MKYSTGLAVSLAVLLVGLFTWGISTDPDGFAGLIKSGEAAGPGAVPLALLDADRRSDALTYKDVAATVAQPPIFTFAPPAPETLDAGFLDFLDQLRAAAEAGDVDAILAASDDQIYFSFDFDPGRARFGAYLTHPDFGAEVRAALVRTLALPAGRADRRTDTSTHCAPWFWCMQLPAGAGVIDPFETVFILGQDVAVLETPGGAELMRLSDAVVRAQAPGDDPEWVRVDLGGGKTGFAAAASVRPLLDHRAVFEIVDGTWKMTVFIAGD